MKALDIKKLDQPVIIPVFKEKRPDGSYKNAVVHAKKARGVVVDAQGDVAVLSGVGMYEAKMTNPVRPEDMLSVEAWWTHLRRSKSKPELGFAGIK